MNKSILVITLLSILLTGCSKQQNEPSTTTSEPVEIQETTIPKEIEADQKEEAKTIIEDSKEETTKTSDTNPYYSDTKWTHVGKEIASDEYVRSGTEGIPDESFKRFETGYELKEFNESNGYTQFVLEDPSGHIASFKVLSNVPDLDVNLYGTSDGMINISFKFTDQIIEIANTKDERYGIKDYCMNVAPMAGITYKDYYVYFKDSGKGDVSGTLIQETDTEGLLVANGSFEPGGFQYDRNEIGDEARIALDELNALELVKLD